MLLGTQITDARRERGHAISLKFIKKFEYFVPCYYDLEKGRDPDSIEVRHDANRS